MKSGLLARGRPRSSATILSFVSASSAAMMPPVQPKPTNRMSTGASLVAMISPRLGQICDAQRLDRVWLVAIGCDLVGKNDARAGKAEHLPHRLVLVAAVDRVGEIA